MSSKSCGAQLSFKYQQSDNSKELNVIAN